MSQKVVTAAIGASLVLAGVLTASDAPAAQKRRVLVSVDPTRTTHLTIRPFASSLKRSVTPAPADLKGRAFRSCSACVTYHDGVTDADCSIDF